MSDLFHEILTTAAIDLLHAVIAADHWHTFLVLTKRPGACASITAIRKYHAALPGKSTSCH